MSIKIVVVKSLLNLASVALWLEIAILKQSCRSFNTVDRTFSCVPSFKKRCARKKERNKTVPLLKVILILKVFFLSLLSELCCRRECTSIVLVCKVFSETYALLLFVCSSDVHCVLFRERLLQFEVCCLGEDLSC